MVPWSSFLWFVCNFLFFYFTIIYKEIALPHKVLKMHSLYGTTSIHFLSNSSSICWIAKSMNSWYFFYSLINILVFYLNTSLKALIEMFILLIWLIHQMNGVQCSLKEGTLNWEMLQFKSKFPREVLLCRVG